MTSEEEQRIGDQIKSLANDILLLSQRLETALSLLSDEELIAYQHSVDRLQKKHKENTHEKTSNACPNP